ncbi:MAG: DUF5686 and carboxypeptidase regulatory-like domain-containing protein [Bacteroidota bacterium]
MKHLTLLSFLICCFGLETFAGEISGVITSSNGEPLPFASIYVRGTTTGTNANQEGRYTLELDEGDYELVYQYIGYKELIKSVVITSGDLLLNVTLEPESYELSQIVVAADAEDPAYRVIREAIKKRKYYRELVESYNCDVYIKGNQKLLDAPEKILGQEIGDFGGSLDSNRQGIVYLSESVSKLYYERPNTFKEVMISSKVSGNDNGFSFNQARLANFNFYDNKIDIGRPNISPIAQNALLFYEYKLEGVFYDKDGRLINKIAVIPKKELDPVFRGYIYITEDLWNIHSTELYLTKDATKIPVLDTLQLNQVFVPVKEDIWMMLSQTIRFRIKVIGFDVVGYFTGVTSNYEINTDYEKGFFTNEVFTVEKEANKKDTVYWNEFRPIPLTEEERLDYIKKDSLQIVWKSKEYLDSVDRKNNRFKPLSILTGYSYNRSYKKKYLEFEPPLNTLQFNAVQGFNLALQFSYRKEFDDIRSQWFSLEPEIQYGFSDNNFRGKARFTFNFNRTNFTRFYVEGGHIATQYNPNAITPSLNTGYALFGKKNYMKLYEKTFGKAWFRQEVVNGIFLITSLEYANRSALQNTTNYSFRGGRSEVPHNSNHPLDPTNFDLFFEEHQALTFNLSLRFRFNQKYLKYPDRKFIMGSKLPDIWLHYRRGIPVLGGDTDFDRLTFQVRDNLPMGLFGTSRFNVEGGWFLTDAELPFIDLKHFNGNQTIFADTRFYRNAFQLLPYYDYSTGSRFLQAHFEHHFDGFLWNKLPGLKKLGFQVVGGFHYLRTPEQGNYYEANIGIDNIGWKIFRFLRVDFFAGFKPGEPFQHRFLIGLNIPNN